VEDRPNAKHSKIPARALKAKVIEQIDERLEAAGRPEHGQQAAQVRVTAGSRVEGFQLMETAKSLRWPSNTRQPALSRRALW